jgi:hypothetical protein
MGGVKGLMQDLASRASKGGGYGLQTPPNLAVTKSGGYDDLAPDENDTHDVAMRKTILRSRRAASQAGVSVDPWYLRNPNNTLGSTAESNAHRLAVMKAAKLI